MLRGGICSGLANCALEVSLSLDKTTWTDLVTVSAAPGEQVWGVDAVLRAAFGPAAARHPPKGAETRRGCVEASGLLKQWIENTCQ